MRRCFLLVLGLALLAGWGARGADPARLRAYGEHLAQECVVCHRIDGGPDKGIASIVGWEPSTFITTLKAYRDRQFAERRNPVMVSVASSLTDEEVEALAAYFAQIKQ